MLRTTDGLRHPHGIPVEERNLLQPYAEKKGQRRHGRLWPRSAPAASTGSGPGHRLGADSLALMRAVEGLGS